MITDSKEKLLGAYAWGLSSLVSIIALVAWGQSYQWKLTHLSTYQIFPLLGLVAFSIMWSHYAVSVIRNYLGIDKKVIINYIQITSWIVLIAILLHPSLLIYQLYRDGAGFPPASYYHYVAPGMGWITLLGTLSLFVFLTYEFRRKFGGRSWWKYINYLTDLAMLGIFYHGLRLGSQLHSGWFRLVWIFYGVSLVGFLVYTYSKKMRSTNQLDQKVLSKS